MAALIFYSTSRIQRLRFYPSFQLKLSMLKMSGRAFGFSSDIEMYRRAYMTLNGHGPVRLALIQYASMP